MRPYPPLGLLYISAWLEKNGFENQVFDSTFSTKAALRKHLEVYRPDIVALYTNLLTKINVVAIIDFVKSSPALKNTLVIVGGPDVTYNIENYLNSGADLVVIGEGEQTMLEITHEFKKGTLSWKSIPGVAFVLPDGSVFKTAAREKIKNIDILPIPNRSNIDLGKYLSVWLRHHGRSAISVSTQRGCPYTCRWCSTAVYGQSYRRRSAKSVVDELELLREQYNPGQIWFVDDVFTVSHKWIEAFHQEVISRNVMIPFECITRAERLDEEILKRLKESGCFRIWIGAESGSQKVLDVMDRRVDAKVVQSMIKKTRTQGIETGTFIMLGYPGETESDIIETLDYLKASNPDFATYTLSYPIKGTMLYNEVESHFTKKLDWQKSTDRDIDFKRTYSRKYYRYALPWLMKSFELFKKQKIGKRFSLVVLKLYLLTWALRLGMLIYRRAAKRENAV